jgi:UDP-N-acetyl-2-amino-2-deoxyglucuronate dehydrogenase
MTAAPADGKPQAGAPEAATSPQRVAVIGCGDISALHFAAIATVPSAELVAVCDTDAARLSAAADGYGVPGYSDYVAMFDEAKPDVVHICTPHHLHASMAVDALDRGIHVILEKPLAHTRAEGARLVDAAARSSAKIAICFQNRYNTPVRAAYDLVASGKVGNLLGASATVLWHRTADYYLDRPWRGQWATGGGGLLMNQAIHTLDLVQWLVGPVSSVAGNTSTRALGDVIEVEDTAEMLLTHENGVRSVFFATLANSVNAPVAIDIVAQNATLSLRSDLTVTWSDGRVEVVTESVAAEGERSYWGVSHERLIEDFYLRLENPEPFWIGAAEAQKSLDLIQDVYDQTYPERAARTMHGELMHTTERTALS